MTPPIKLTPEARQDLVAAAKWYEERQTRLGARLVAEVEEVLVRIGERPHSFPLAYRTMRRASADRFPYGVFFQELEGTIYVVAIVDLRRHPRTWKRRFIK